MEHEGYVRADLAAANHIEEINGNMKPNSDSKPEIDTPTTKNVGEVNEQYPWQMAMSKVLCTNLLASGAFGSVFHGLYKDDDVAVKIINTPPNTSSKQFEKLRTDFVQEVSVWHTLKHPNIVQFIGASMDGRDIRAPRDGTAGNWDYPVFVMVTEYMGGGTLKGYITRKKKLPLKQVTKMALDIAKGFEYLHSKNIVHRDLKSENLLLDHDANVKIADFGVARAEALNPVDMTCETGTVRWMAPEVIDHQPYDRKCDVYSFGIVLWELFTCDHPFKQLTFVQLAFNVVSKGMRPDIPENCPATLKELMENCWNQNPQKRPEFFQVVRTLKEFQMEISDGQSDDGKKSPSCGCTIV